MNPLVVTRGLGKLVNTMLVDDDPVGQTDLLAYQCLGIFDGFYTPQTFPLIRITLVTGMSDT